MTELTIDRPIEGNGSNRSTARVAQQGPAEFLVAIDNLLAQDGVLSVNWQQYIPYFNDGEPCEFTVPAIYVKLDGRFVVDADDEDEYEDEYEDSFEERRGYFDKFDLRGRVRYNAPDTFTVNGQDTKHIFDAMFGMGQFEDVLRQNFGDDAEVTATKDGFKVEYYEPGY